MLLCVIVPTPVAVPAKEVSAVVPPTAPVKVIVPEPPKTASVWAPLIVLLKVTLALLEVMVLAPVNVTGLGKFKGLAPVTVMLFPIWIKDALVKTRFVKAALPPTAPVNVTVPVPAARLSA